MWAALERFETVTDSSSRYARNQVPEDPGAVHVYAAGWPIREYEHAPEFLGGIGPRALCGVRVLVRLPVIYVRDDPEACENCADLLAQGVSTPPRSALLGPCRDVIQPGGHVEAAAYMCVLRKTHDGPHRATGGQTWETGPDDFIPGPDGYV